MILPPSTTVSKFYVPNHLRNVEIIERTKKARTERHIIKLHLLLHRNFTQKLRTMAGSRYAIINNAVPKADLHFALGDL